jgi:N-acetylglucosaminyl-diphospho-decaprenol L-rhamnosyltransferase
VAFRHIRFSRSKVRYFCKYHGRVAGHLVRAWLLFNYMCEWAIEGIKWSLGHKRSLRRERMRVYAQVIRSRLTVG